MGLDKSDDSLIEHLKAVLKIPEEELISVFDDRPKN
jgi:hypothetical protein